MDNISLTILYLIMYGDYIHDTYQDNKYSKIHLVEELYQYNLLLVSGSLEAALLQLSYFLHYFRYFQLFQDSFQDCLY